MAEIKAFKGLRYSETAGDISMLCCPPYDIINDEQRAEFLKQNPHNIIRLELPKSLNDTDNNDSYNIAGEVLKDWISKGILKNDDTECLYVYEMEFKPPNKSEAEIYKIKGYIGLVKLEEFSKGIILPHEETLSKAKTDRFSLMTATNCNFSQIYSLYMDGTGEVYETIESTSLGSPNSEYTDGDGVTHRLWLVSDSNIIKKVSSLMVDKKVYIADGHHRYETALNYRNSLLNARDSTIQGTAEYVPMMLVNIENDGLLVFPTHRIIKGLLNFDYQECLKNCSEYFDITENLTRENAVAALEEAYNNEKKAFLLYTKNNFTLLMLKDLGIMNNFMPDSSSALKGLDVSVLHTLVLNRILGIDKENMANQKNLIYTRILEESISAVDNGHANCAFLLNPTRVSEISQVAAAGEKMPQKSTYFYPKLTTGLVMNQIIK